METILEKYGWIAMIAYVIFKDVVPWAMNKWYPERIKQEQAKRNTDALLLKNEIDEKEFQRKMQERQTIALERVGEAVTTMKERLENLTDLNLQHNAFTIEAVTAMRETVAKNKRDTQEKMKAIRTKK